MPMTLCANRIVYELWDLPLQFWDVHGCQKWCALNYTLYKSQSCQLKTSQLPLVAHADTRHAPAPTSSCACFTCTTLKVCEGIDFYNNALLRKCRVKQCTDSPHSNPVCICASIILTEFLLYLFISDCIHLSFCPAVCSAIQFDSTWSH